MYGVRKRSQAAICCFVISLLLMFIVEIAVGIAAAVVLKVRPCFPDALTCLHSCPPQKEAADISAQLLNINSTLTQSMPPEVKKALAGDGVGMAAVIITMALLQLVQVCCAISFRRAISSGAYASDEEDQGLTSDKKDKKFNATLSKLAKM
jgi:hypothetical protein